MRSDAPLHLIVPLPAGGTSDVIARILADGLREDLGRPVIIDNRPGASGRIAVEALKSAAPDGTTLLLAPVAVPVIVPLVSRVNYDPMKDLVPVAQITTFDFGIAVAPAHPARTLAELAAWAKENAARATYGTPGIGSGPHLIGALFAKDAGIELLHVPYRGAGGVEVDVMNGAVAVGISALTDFTAAHRSGKLRIIATSGARRSPLAPEVPTFGEQGFRGFALTGWHGVFAPAKTPPALVDQLSAAIGDVLKTPGVRGRLTTFGLEPSGSTSRALASRITADIESWRGMVKALGFVPE